MPDRSTIVRGIVCAALLVWALAAVAPAAAAPVESGTVTITQSKSLRTLLAGEGVKLAGIAGARNSGATIELSGNEGTLDQTYGSGYLELGGALRFKSGKRKVVFRDLVLNTAKKELRAKVGGRKGFLLAKTALALPAPTAFGVDLWISALPLSAKAAKLLNERFGLERPVRSGWSLGKTQVSTTFYGVPIAGGTLGFAFDEGFRQKLEALEVDATAFAGGAQTGASPLAFSWPIQPSLTNAALSRGWVGNEGGIAFFQGEGPASEEGQLQRMVRLWQFRLDFEANAAAASVEARGGDGSFLTTFGPTFAQIDVRAATRIDAGAKLLSMAPTPATLDPGAAAALNQNFAAGKATRFVPGEPFGSFSFSAALQ